MFGKLRELRQTFDLGKAVFVLPLTSVAQTFPFECASGLVGGPEPGQVRREPRPAEDAELPARRRRLPPRRGDGRPRVRARRRVRQRRAHADGDRRGPPARRSALRRRRVLAAPAAARAVPRSRRRPERLRLPERPSWPVRATATAAFCERRLVTEYLLGTASPPRHPGEECLGRTAGTPRPGGAKC